MWWNWNLIYALDGRKKGAEKSKKCPRGTIRSFSSHYSAESSPSTGLLCILSTFFFSSGRHKPNGLKWQSMSSGEVLINQLLIGFCPHWLVLIQSWAFSRQSNMVRAAKGLKFLTVSWENESEERKVFCRLRSLLQRSRENLRKFSGKIISLTA